ncbi:MAG TPA: glycoside hydrolase family 3 N-terminal domain-containing protein [Brevundimonas sp.]
MAAALAALLAGQATPGLGQSIGDATAHPALWPTAHSPAALTGPATEARVRELLSRMTIEEKVGQLIQADIGAITPADLAAYPIGSILAGGSSSPNGDERSPPQAWLELSRAYRAAALARPGAAIPLLFGVDAVHGHNNIVGATLFPHNIGLGATRDPELIRRIVEATAAEVAATGANWTFGPTLAVPRDDRWGRTYEGFAETPQVARSYAGAFVEGLQGPLRDGGPLASGHVMGSAKHFLADGGTADGRDRGDAVVSEQELIDIHLSGYREAIDAGVLSIMVSFSGWNGVKHTGNRSLLTDVLRGPLGFDGLLIGDWDAHAFVPGCRPDSCPAAINAGLDMFMAPNAWKPLFVNTLAQARSGEISAARLDEAVRRILRVKVVLGVLDAPNPAEGDVAVIGSADHRALARRAVGESLVLLKNNDATLPIRAGARVLVVGDAADDIGQASGGWTISWQGTGNTNADFPGATSIWAGVRDVIMAGGGSASLSPDGAFTDRPDVAIVVFGETPYAETYGDLDTLDFAPTGPLETLKRLKAAGVPTVSVFLSGRPLWTNPEINASDAFVAAWLPGSEGAGIADVLIGNAEGKARHDFKGVLGFSWPRSAGQSPQNVGQPDYDPQFAYGYGLRYGAPAQTPILSEEPGVSPDAAGPPRFFANGRFVAPWALTLRDSSGNFRVEAPGPASSPGGALTLAPVDGQSQESARRLTFVGGREASAVIGGAPTRFAPGLALRLSYRLESPPAEDTTLWLGSRGLRIASALKTETGWTSLTVPLSCFGGAADATVSAIRLGTAGAMTLSFEEVRLTSAGDASCACFSEAPTA